VLSRCCSPRQRSTCNEGLNMRVVDLAGTVPGRYCSPRHTPTFQSRVNNRGFKTSVVDLAGASAICQARPTPRFRTRSIASQKKKRAG